MNINWSKGNGLVPCIAQDATTGDVLTLAYMNEEALRMTRETGFIHYYSRSRNKLWKKGEESGNVQEVLSLTLDCDGDSILAKVKRHGPACHTGAQSCFHEPLHGERDVLLQDIERVIDARRANPNESSHTTKLLASENLRLKKLAEEAGEVIMAAKDHDKAKLADEAADVVYHLMVILRAEGAQWRDVLDVLERRRK